MPKGRQPIIKPAFQKMYGDSWIECVKKNYSGLTPEEAHKKFQEDVKNEVVISQSSLYVFILKEIEGFSFASKRTGEHHLAVLQPALEKSYGDDWKNAFMKTCEGLAVEEATERINKDLNLSVSAATVLNNAKKLGIVFKKTPKVVNPDAKRRGKPNLTLKALLDHFKTEDALKAAFKKMEGYKVKDIAESINSQAGTNIPPGNMYNVIKGFNIELSCKRNRKSANTEIPVDSEVPEGVEIPQSKGNNTPVKFTCQTKGCKGEIGQMVDLDYGFGIRARRCKECNEFGTFKAQYRKPDGTIASVILKEVEGITCEVDENEIPQEIEAKV